MLLFIFPSVTCFRQRSDLNCAVALAKWIIHALNLEERVVNVVSSVLSVPVEDWTELVGIVKPDRRSLTPIVIGSFSIFLAELGGIDGAWH